MSFPRYPEYKDSGVEWLGEVPAHWDVTRLGSYFHERREKVSDTEFQPLSVTKNGILPQLETAAKTDDGENRKKVCAGDFVINSRSDRKGSSGISNLDGSVSLINIVLSVSNNFSGGFADFILKSILFQEEFYRFGKGIVADLWSTNYSEMRNIRIPVPPLSDQNEISQALIFETSKIDALIAEQEHLIALLKEKRQAVISHAVTKGLNPDVPMKESGVEWLGQVPAHWTVTRLKFLAQVRSGVAKGRDIAIEHAVEVPYLRVANVQDGYLDLDDVARIQIGAHELNRYRLLPGDVLMNEGGDFDKLGRGHVWRGEIDDCIHQNHVFAVRPHDVEPEWISLLTSTHAGRFYFMSRSKQSTNLASISSSNIAEFTMPLPPLAERAAIVAVVTTEVQRINDLLAQATSAITLLQERRSALISAAVTGKIDVRGLAAASGKAA
jgi:type I restriction enzyme S subunit